MKHTLQPVGVGPLPHPLVHLSIHHVHLALDWEQARGFPPAQELTPWVTCLPYPRARASQQPHPPAAHQNDTSWDLLSFPIQDSITRCDC